MFKSTKFLQVHLYSDHPTQRAASPVIQISPKQALPLVDYRPEIDVGRVPSPGMTCEICSRRLPTLSALQQVRHFCN